MLDTRPLYHRTLPHAIGTGKALELGQAEGAMSSLAIVLAGLMTAALAPVCMGLW